ncbi:MAG TPA: chemotaxis protein CheW [Patescibacteria group bacterium]|nr:chemotaxis protein CheW [Patescibacteria group bacterium]
MKSIQLVIFKLCGEEYGVNISKVKEIEPFREATKLPDIEDYIEGIINVRGDIIGVINMKKRLRLKEHSIIPEARTIIVSIGHTEIGFVVDEASEVISVNSDDIEPVSDMFTSISVKFIEGIAKIGERIVIILDMNKIFGEIEKSA